uniref:Uncharacterized protein n=1 Tax=Rousettus aegyptiacus TaxID=9407 RepID=A0A7J8BAT1_ROUAE|nr:hypothetical protein HJG63_009985 [Rousettus aegyptiacus]
MSRLCACLAETGCVERTLGALPHLWPITRAQTSLCASATQLTNAVLSCLAAAGSCGLCSGGLCTRGAARQCCRNRQRSIVFTDRTACLQRVQALIYRALPVPGCSEALVVQIREGVRGQPPHAPGQKSGPMRPPEAPRAPRPTPIGSTRHGVRSGTACCF